MTLNKKQLILESFQNMNLSMLDVLLDDSRTYQNVVKNVFIEKLDTVFTRLKDKGDTHLLAFKGVCISKECDNKGCAGYSFIGNNSKQHIDLIFDELSEDVNDIYQCFTFDRIDKSIVTEDLISFNIKFDEKADFKPSIEFLIKSNKCESAYNELLKYKDRIIDKDVYIPWLKKYYELYKSFDLPPLFYRDQNNFHSLYYKITDLKNYLKVSNLAEEAVETFKTTINIDENYLLKWLTKFEQTGDKLTLFWYFDIELEQKEQCDYFTVNGLKIATFDFLFIAKFKCLFEDHYWNMLEKYTTINDDEIKNHANKNGTRKSYVYSLAYHLDKRGILLS